MGAYQSLFNFAIEHTYFTDLVCKSLNFIPTDLSAALLKKAGLLLKPSENGISVFYEENKKDILRLHAEDAEDGLKLQFKVFSKDPYFLTYTTPAAKADDSVLYFSNKQLTQDEAGRQRLHSDGYVSETAYQKMTSAELSGVLSQKDYLVKPNLIVQIVITADDPIFRGTPDAAAKRYYIRFNTHLTFWKYYILGELVKRQIYIADLDNEIKFEDIGNVMLPGHRKAVMLQSSSAMPMQETHSQRFQLREHGDMGDRVLIKRMPNACISSMDGKIVDGKIEAISEIYIN